MIGIILIPLFIFFFILIIIILACKSGGRKQKQEVKVELNLGEKLRERELEAKHSEERNILRTNQQKYFCPNCGVVQGDITKFCSSCGAKLDR